MKWLLYGVLAVGLVVGWTWFMKQGDQEAKDIAAQIEKIEQQGSVEELETIPTLQEKIENTKSQKTLTGIMLSFLTAGLVGIVFVIDILPAIAHRFTHAVYDSAEMIEEDPMHDARAKLAQGDYEGSVAAFRDAAAADPMNRLPVVEIAKIQREHLHDPAGAVQTLRGAIEGQEWAENDAAFLMFRLAEVYDEDIHDRISAASILQQVIEQFPNSRHSANARTRLHEWGVA